ncbi:MAG: acyl-CoA dehydrogenase [Bacteroidota bacterium]
MAAPLAPIPPDALGSASEQTVALLPLLYLAWADGVLTPSEVAEIRQRIGAQTWLAAADKQQLVAWLDPLSPPTATQYRRWMRAIRTAARHIPDDRLGSLAKLGLGMAEVAGVSAGDGAATEVIGALHDLEGVLGPAAEEALTELLAERPDATPLAAIPEPQFDVAALQALLDGTYVDLRERVKTVLADPLFDPMPVLDTAAARERALRWCKHLAAQGFGALAFPAYAGGENSIAKFIVAFETIAAHDLGLVVKYGVQFGLWGGSVNQLGTARHRRAYLPKIGSMELPGCFAMSELGHGSNVRDMETTATFDGATGEFVINTPRNLARKEWIGNAANHGRMATVFAQLQIPHTDANGDTEMESYGVHAFLVPIRSADGCPMPRVRIQDGGEKMGLNGVDNGRLWFDQVRIPRENLLDRFASVSEDGTYDSPIPSEGRRFFTMLSTLVGGRIAVGSGGNSAAKVGLTIALRYGARRRQFGPKNRAEVPILDYLSHQRRLFPLLAKVYALHFALAKLRDDFAAARPGDDLQEIEARANALKAFATWNCTETLQVARESCGGQGYLWENRLAAHKRDSDIFTTFEGDNTVLMLQVAKGLLSDYANEFKNLSTLGKVRHALADRVEQISHLNPLLTVKKDPAHLRDAAFHLDAFRQRERDLQVGAAGRIRRRIDEGMDAFDAFVEVQDHLLTAAWAYAKRETLDAFHEAVEAADDPTLKALLGKLCTLYALHDLEEDRGWFLEQGYMDGSKAKAVRAEVNALLGELRPHAVGLVDAFGLPDAIIAAPIGTREVAERT